MMQPGYNPPPSRRPVRYKLRAGDYFLLAAIVAFFFEGAVRKWLLPLGHPLSYPVVMSKEILAVVGLLVSPRRLGAAPTLDRFRHYLIGAPLVLTVAGCLMGAFSAINPVGAIMTFRALIIMPLGACMVGRLLRRELLWPALAVIGVCTLVNAPLSVVQFYSPRTSLINAYVGGSLEGVSTSGFSDNVRATGTFSYITGLGFASMVGTAAGMTAIYFSRRPLQRLFGWAVLLSGVILALATVSRGAIFACAALILFAIMRSRTAPLLAMVVACLVLLNPFTSPTPNGNPAGEAPLHNLLTGVFSRSQIADSTTERLTAPFFEFYHTAIHFPFGEGLGIGQTAARRFGAAGTMETELGRIVYEIGVVGAMGYFLTYLGAVVFLFHLRSATSDGRVRTALIGASLLCLILMYAGVAFNHIASTVFWSVFVSACYFSDSTRPAPSPGRAVPPLSWRPA